MNTLSAASSCAAAGRQDNHTADHRAERGASGPSLTWNLRNPATYSRLFTDPALAPRCGRLLAGAGRWFCVRLASASNFFFNRATTLLASPPISAARHRSFQASIEILPAFFAVSLPGDLR